MASNGHVNGTSSTKPLPNAPPFDIHDGSITIQPPLTHKGSGPGLVLVVDESLPLQSSSKTLDPPPLLKWAEEGYAVAQVKLAGRDGLDAALRDALQALDDLTTCTNDSGYGLIVYSSGETIEGGSISVGDKGSLIRAVVSYGPAISGIAKSIPQLVHAAASERKQEALKEPSKIYHYEDKDHFVLPSHPNYAAANADVAHTRTLTFIKPLLGGPYFNIEALWDEHAQFEFVERNVEKTMATMVAEPYVNHIPTMTGGIGRQRLTNFYRDHFIFSNPDDTNLKLVSRTVGVDRVIDEFLTCFTHDRMIDWLLPGVPPTGKYVEIPFTSVVNLRGDRLFREHINWDQATALRQIGLLPEYLPFPYPINGKKPAPGKRFEYKVPTAGIDTSRKLVDESSVESNHMFEFAWREVDDK